MSAEETRKETGREPAWQIANNLMDQNMLDVTCDQAAKVIEKTLAPENKVIKAAIEWCHNGGWNTKSGSNLITAVRELEAPAPPKEKGEPPMPRREAHTRPVGFYDHISPDLKDLEKNKLAEPQGERLRAELESWLEKNGIVSAAIETKNHFTRIDIAKLPDEIRPVLSLWGSIYVKLDSVADRQPTSARKFVSLDTAALGQEPHFGSLEDAEHTMCDDPKCWCQPASANLDAPKEAPGIKIDYPLTTIGEQAAHDLGKQRGWQSAIEAAAQQTDEYLLKWRAKDPEATWQGLSKAIRSLRPSPAPPQKEGK